MAVPNVRPLAAAAAAAASSPSLEADPAASPPPRAVPPTRSLSPALDLALATVPACRHSSTRSCPSARRRPCASVSPPRCDPVLGCTLDPADPPGSSTCCPLTRSPVTRSRRRTARRACAATRTVCRPPRPRPSAHGRPRASSSSPTPTIRCRASALPRAPARGLSAAGSLTAATARPTSSDPVRRREYDLHVPLSSSFPSDFPSDPDAEPSFSSAPPPSASSTSSFFSNLFGAATGGSTGHADAEATFTSVFADLLEPEVGRERHGRTWSLVGGAGGAACGFIVGNLPGAVAGGASSLLLRLCAGRNEADPSDRLILPSDSVRRQSARRDPRREGQGRRRGLLQPRRRPQGRDPARARGKGLCDARRPGHGRRRVQAVIS